MLFLLKSKGTAIYFFFQNKNNKKKKRARERCGREGSQEFLKKPHFKKKNGSTKFSVLEVRIDSMQHFPLFLFLVCWLSSVLAGWVGLGRYIKADFKGATVPPFSSSVSTPSVVLQREGPLM